MAARALGAAACSGGTRSPPARELALKALTLDEAFQPGTRSWTELAFGRAEDGDDASSDLPWPPTAQVTIPGTERAHPRQHRSARSSSGRRTRVRVSDYKTGAEPRQAERDRARTRRRAAARALCARGAPACCPDNPRVVARLFFLGDEEPKAVPAARRRRRRSPRSASHVSGRHRAPAAGHRLARPGCARGLERLPVGAAGVADDVFPDQAGRLRAAPSATSPGSGARDDGARRQPARLRALTDLDATLLVEAAAGTGKTALMAGRLTMLLAQRRRARLDRGHHLHRACGERAVGARVHRYVERASWPDEMPEPLRTGVARKA